MDSDVVIKVNHIGKAYPIYEKPVDRLKESWSITRKSYHKDFHALKDIDFEVKRGECIGIVGTNGSGKSTLLKIITGVLTPSKGSVEVHGRISALLELGAGFNMEYTGKKNIYLNGTMMGYSKEEMDKRYKDIVDFAEIGEFVNQPVKTYSSGMFARLAFAVAINVDPDILIVDEALSVGDVFFQAKCFRKFNEFQDKGKTILFVSHDMGSVMKYCSRCVLINNGEQIKVGDTPDVVNSYRRILVNNYSKYEAVDSGEENTITWKERLTLNNSFMEYGDESAEIIDYAVMDDNDVVTNVVLKGHEYKIKMKVKFYQNIKSPIFAVKLRDLKGVELTGTNTLFENCMKESASAGEIVTVSFRQKMLLQGGQYLLSISCTGYENDDFVAHHRLVDICNVQVLSDKNTVGVFDSESVVDYE